MNDTEVADELVSGDEEAVYADKAYGSKERSEGLKSMKIKDRIMRRANKHHPELPLREQQERADIPAARAGRAGVRDAEAHLRLRAGAVQAAGEERDGVAVQGHGVQPAEGRPAPACRRLTAGGGVRPEAEEGPGEHGEAWETGQERLAAGHRQAPPPPAGTGSSSPHGASAALRKGLVCGGGLRRGPAESISALFRGFLGFLDARRHIRIRRIVGVAEDGREG